MTFTRIFVHLPSCLHLVAALTASHPNLLSLRLRLLWLLSVEIPIVQVSASRTQVRRKAQPAEIGDQSPARTLVDLAPDVGEVAVEADKSKNITSGFDGAAKAEEEGHPDEVQAELDGVEGGSLLRISLA
jgi:hypothetical protein